ncbi:RNA polymerase sigma factor [Pseudidiomarina sp. 1APP75-32.1]|uniref:RNA polymerase sigma factor n=1 Tax=Pseudidiomarina terrestris TaxID=2820060 RepID=A0AAW7QXH9_9GAMM|nr:MULTISPECIES: RNA polymerase sigma factor [unclassified Pseudidiomarina]MDN7123452.1 RNA polymerase sigma factor [Pseudidiomarina sp. 1APP75-32.1]MDN7128823.1 RNA polymerase sigma factor [Pseudidiomarina sp. 1APR75-15]
MKQFSDEQLIAIAQSSAERSAFDELFRRYHAQLRNFLKGKTQQATADDVLQETYIKAFTKINTFKSESSFSTWLFSIAINEYKQSLRKGGLFEKLKESLFRQPPAQYSEPAVDLIIDFSRRAAALSSEHYNVYVLSRVYGCSHREIAERASLPLGTVKTYISQAEKQLKLATGN